MRQTLDLCFKGQRDYLQGADICNALLHSLGCDNVGHVAGLFQLAFHEFASRQLEVVTDVTGDPPSDIIATFSLGDDNQVRGWIAETEAAVTCRQPYPEDNIIACCRLAENCITTDSAPPFSPMEIAVAMTKALHNQLLPPADKRWIFSRLSLRRLFRKDETHPLAIELQQNLNNRLTRSSVRVGDEVIGDIFFSRV